MLLGNIFQQLYNIVDSIIVGKYLGKEALASVGASFPVIFTIIALVIGIGGGASVVISQYFGANDKESVKKAVDTLNIFLLVTGLVISVTGIMFSRWIFTLLQLPDELMESATTYLNIYLMGMLVFFGFNSITSIRCTTLLLQPFSTLASTSFLCLDLSGELLVQHGLQLFRRVLHL
jgi:Na+-driven multidrug efflux pump